MCIRLCNITDCPYQANLHALTTRLNRVRKKGLMDLYYQLLKQRAQHIAEHRSRVHSQENTVSARLKRKRTHTVHVEEEKRYTGSGELVEVVKRHKLILTNGTSQSYKASVKMPVQSFTSDQRMAQTANILDQAFTGDKLDGKPEKPEKPEKPGRYVYVLRAVDTPFVKIGYSKNPTERLMSLQTGNMYKLSLVYLRFSLQFSCLEHYLHSYFTTAHVQGEWFAVPEDYDFQVAFDSFPEQ